MRISLTLIILFSTCQWLSAQDYLVNLQRDTLYGEIDILLPTDVTEDIILEHDGEKSRFHSHQFLEISVDSVLYRPIKFQGKYSVMRLIKEGYLSLYTYRYEGGHEFATKYLHKKTLDGLEVPNILFKQQVSSFLSDCEEVSEKVKNKDYKKKDLLEIINAYNQCIESGTEERIANVENPTLALIDKLILENDDQEFVALLRDIKSKLRSGDSIPTYMISALENTGATSENKTELINQLRN